MTERPILFSGPMVRAILDGRKTQTRRVLKGAWQAALEGHDHVKTWFAPHDVPAAGIPNQWAESGIWVEKWGPRGYNRHLGFSPFRPGDRLWVREAWAPLAALTHGDPGVQALADRGFYRADNSTVEGEISTWRPSIHMPRWASRISLDVTGVKVERLQDISKDDAIAEGLQRLPETGRWAVEQGGPCCDRTAFDPRTAFGWLWTSINGPGSWDTNPWVIAITFQRVMP